MNDALTIGELARQVGMRPSALRYYESIGLLPTPRRVNGQRRYDISTVQLLAVLQMAQKAGFMIAEMQTLVHGFESGTPPAVRWQRLARTKLTEIDALIQRAEQMKRILHHALHCGCRELVDCAAADEMSLCQQRPPSPV